VAVLSLGRGLAISIAAIAVIASVRRGDRPRDGR